VRLASLERRQKRRGRRVPIEGSEGISVIGLVPPRLHGKGELSDLLGRMAKRTLERPVGEYANRVGRRADPVVARESRVERHVLLRHVTRDACSPRAFRIVVGMRAEGCCGGEFGVASETDSIAGGSPKLF
jgi:hypothetical protein